MSTERTLPAGFTLKRVATKAAGFSYEVEAPQAESLDAILAFYKDEGKNGEDIILKLWNAGNEQGAKQGAKDEVRKAVEAGDDAARDTAVAKHQETARVFVQGAPRGGGGTTHETGLTKKEREALGTAVAMEIATTGEAPSKARMAEIASELGISVEAIGHTDA